MTLANIARNEAANGVIIDRVRLHSGDPGASGADNQLGSLIAATFPTATNGVRALAADILVTGLAPNQAVSHLSFWQNSGTVFKGSEPRTSGDATANAAGEYTIKAGTGLTIT
jgi:hypothetical protein